ncbi:MAG: hypothetical protein RLY67_177, partial [Pseudomonadota bacterium]
MSSLFIPFSVLASAVLFTASAQAAGLNASEQSAIDQANSSIQALEV